MLAIGFIALVCLALFGCNDASTTDEFEPLELRPLVKDTVKVTQYAKVN